MLVINVELTIEDELLFQFQVDKNTYQYEVFSSDPEIVNVNSSDFVPRKGDFWDKSTNTLISKHEERKQEIIMKDEEDLNNWVYFAYIDKDSNVLLITKWYLDDSDMQNYIISVFNNSPKVTIKEYDDDFYDDDELELEINSKNAN
jgi:hypothetical protein